MVYKNKNFVKILKINSYISTNDVINTNNCYISICKTKYKNKYIISGNKRDLNRYKWNKNRLENLLKNKKSKQSLFYQKNTKLILIKKQNKAFHPTAKRENLKMGKKIFCFNQTTAYFINVEISKVVLHNQTNTN